MNITKYVSTLYIGMDDDHSQYTEICRDGCRTSLLIAGVVIVSAIFILYFHPAIPSLPFI